MYDNEEDIDDYESCAVCGEYLAPGDEILDCHRGGIKHHMSHISCLKESKYVISNFIRCPECKTYHDLPEDCYLANYDKTIAGIY